MAHPDVRMNDLDSYIRQIEAREKGKKKKMILFLALGLVLASAGAIPFVLSGGQQTLRHFDGESMTIYRLDSILESDPGEIVLVYGPGVEPDTIKSVEEFYETRNFNDVEPTVSLQEEFQFSDDESQDGDFTEVVDKSTTTDGTQNDGGTGTDSKTKLQKFSFAIEGERQPRTDLKFTIVDYDENVNYTLDFGNGIRKRVYKRISYSYPKKGNYLINLIATNETNATSIYSRHIAILEEPQAQKANEQATAFNNIAPSNINSNEGPSGDEKEESFSELLRNDPDKQPSDPVIQDEDPVVADAENDEVKEQPEKKVDLTPKAAGPLIFAEKMPSYPGGESAMYKYLRKALRYPRPAVLNEIEGKVYLQFLVQKDGRIRDIKVLKGIGYGCDEEAIRAIKNMPKWVPGQQDGKKVDVFFTTRITFALEKG